MGFSRRYSSFQAARFTAVVCSMAGEARYSIAATVISGNITISISIGLQLPLLSLMPVMRIATRRHLPMMRGMMVAIRHDADVTQAANFCRIFR